MLLMNLHNNKDLFFEIITRTSEQFGIDKTIVEKDYYVSLLLNSLVDEIPEIVFKGGTSLSKCYKIINRFSEDIDITFSQTEISHKKRREIKNKINEICEKLNLKIVNYSEIKSGRDYNCFIIDYSPVFDNNYINSQLLLEIVYMVKPYPIEKQKINSMIQEYLSMNNSELLDRYEFQNLSINTQSFVRTFIDKIFAICDYYLSNNPTRNSRHLYDLHMLWPLVKNEKNIKKMIIFVRTERKELKKCLSAADEININEVINKIIEEKFYINDYNQITKLMLFKDVSYDEVILSLKDILNSKIF